MIRLTTSLKRSKRNVSQFYAGLISGLSLLLYLLSLTPVYGQIGGEHVYEFLELPASARLSGLGEYMISVADRDISLAAANPATLNDKMHGQFSFNHRFYFDQINHGYFAYGSKLPYWQLKVHGGIQYVNYGEFIAADIYGNKIGTFKANEMALILGAAKTFQDRITVGVNTKWIQSRFESYNSLGFALDLGALYTMNEKKMNLGFVIKNLGAQITRYSESREKLPFDVQFAVSKRLSHLPFRLSILAHHLHRWNILYDDPNKENNTIFIGEEQESSKMGVFADNLFRHLVISGEFLIGKNEALSLRLAYNHLKRRELSVDNYLSMAGFSMGIGIKIRRFTLDYSYSIQHLAGGTSHVGVSLNINELIKKI